MRQTVFHVPLASIEKRTVPYLPVEISGNNLTEGDLHLEAVFDRDITDRRKAEEQLLIANFGVQSSISAIRFADLDGRITSVNDSFLRLWGYERAEEVLGRHVSELATSGMEEEGIKALRSSRGYIGRGARRERTKLFFDVQVAVSVVTQIKGKTDARTMASFVDITERKKAEDALRESRLHLSGAMDLAHIVYSEFDPATKKYVFNDPFYALYGTTAEQEGGYRMTRKNYAQRFIHPDDAASPSICGAKSSRQDFESVATSTPNYPSRWRSATYPGTRPKVSKDDSGRIVKRYGANQDITERKHALEALEESENKFRDLVEKAMVGVYLVQQGVFQYVNAKFADIHGYDDPEMMRGLDVRTTILPEDLPLMEETDEWIRAKICRIAVGSE